MLRMKPKTINRQVRQGKGNKKNSYAAQIRLKGRGKRANRSGTVPGRGKDTTTRSR